MAEVDSEQANALPSRNGRQVQRLPSCASGYLAIRSPRSVFNAVRAAAEFVQHHRDNARVHVIMPEEAAVRIQRAIHVVDATILNLAGVAVLAPTFVHGQGPQLDRIPGGISMGHLVWYPAILKKRTLLGTEKGGWQGAEEPPCHPRDRCRSQLTTRNPFVTTDLTPDALAAQ
jgi:hypothetical protein